MNPATQNAVHDGVRLQRPGSRRRTVRWLAWAVPAAATAALGLYEISVPMLWRDELATWSAATRTIPQIWALAHHTDAVLSVYYAGLHLWMAVFGDSPTAMRLPSVLAMSGTAAVVALITRRFASSAPVSTSSAPVSTSSGPVSASRASGTGASGGGESGGGESRGGRGRAGAGSAAAAALAAGLLYAVIPSVSRYAQEARPYAFASLFAALATLALLRAVERPCWQRWAWYVLTLAGAGASNLIALTVLAGHAVIVAAQWRRVSRAPAGGGASPAGRGPHAVRTLLAGFGGSAVVAVILLGPLILEGHRQSYEQLGSQPTPSFTELIGARGALWAQLFSSAHVAAAVVLLAVLSAILAPRRAEAWAALACGVLPIIVVWAVSHGPDQYWTYRYMLFTVPAWAVSAGLGIHELWRLLRGPLGRPWFRYAIGAILVAVIGLAGTGAQREIRTLEAHNIWAYPLRPPNGVPIDYTAAVGVIAAHERPGDGIVYQVNDENRYEVDTAVAYYLRGKPVPHPVFQAESPARANSLAPVDTADRAGALAGRPRIWVIFVNRLPEGTYTDPFTAIPPNEATALRAAGYTTHSLYKKPGITVALLTPR